MAPPAFAQIEIDQAAPLLRCEYCGEELGAYDPLWQELGDGTVTLSSTGERDAHGTGRMWHPSCLGHATVHLIA